MNVKQLIVCLMPSIALCANAGPLLDQFMPYTDYYAEGASDHPCEALGDFDNPSPQLLEDCSLSETSQATIQNLLNALDNGAVVDDAVVTMKGVADTLRDLLAQGLPINSVVDALPPFVRRQLPSMLQSKRCRFLNSGEVSAHFISSEDHASGEPYDDHVALTVDCDVPRNFRLLLTAFGEEVLGQPVSTAFYQQSSVPVQLVSNSMSYPAQVSFLHSGRILSEQVFSSGFGEQDIPIVVRLHSRNDQNSAPKGHGEIIGFPGTAKLVIYELN